MRRPHFAFILLAIAMLLLAPDIARLAQSAWAAYVLIIVLSSFVVLGAGLKNLLELTVFLFLWITFFNLAAVIFLHLGEQHGAYYSVIKIYAEPWHYTALVEEQVYLTAAVLVVFPWISKNLVRGKDSRRSAIVLNHMSNKFWPVVYVVGACAALLLVAMGEGDAALTRRTRVEGLGALVVLQYLAPIGFAMYLVTRPKRPITYDVLTAIIFSIPLVVTHERSFFIAMCLIVVAYHMLFTRRMRIVHLASVLGIGLFAVMAFGVWRSASMGIESEQGILRLFEKDMSMHLGYLLYRDKAPVWEEYHFAPLMLIFAFFSSGLTYLVGWLPQSPNNAFTEMVFPQIGGSTTYSMGYFGEAFYILQEERAVYYCVSMLILCWLGRFIERRDAVMVILVVAFTFRIAKGGIIGGGSVILALLILVYLIRVVGAFISESVTKTAAPRA